MSQNYGALRVVRVRLPDSVPADLQGNHPRGWIPEERLVHLLTRNETTIGRALNNDILLMDPTVSREHARLIKDGQGWHIVNLTGQNTVRVNGRPVPGGSSLPVKPQDFLVLGSTILQLVAPQETEVDEAIPDPTIQLSSLYSELPATEPSHNGASHDSLNGKSEEKQSGELPGMSTAKKFWGWPVVPSTIANGTASALSRPSEPGFSWAEGEEENLLGVGVTMQFALSQGVGKRMRWVIGGIGLAILTISVIVTLIVSGLIGIATLTEKGTSSIVVALTVPLIPALAIVLLANFIDRFEREPWFLRLAAFLWGAIIAVPPSRVIEAFGGTMIQNWLGDINNPLGSLLLGLNAGIPEEAFKGLGILIMYWLLRDEFDNVTDGIVYGALIGAGFALVENFGYFAENTKDFFWVLIIGRVVLGWLSHSTFTICFGVALGYIRHTRIRWQQIVIPVAGYLVAVLFHSAFDFVDWFANGLVINETDTTIVTVILFANYIPPFLAQVAILYFLMKSLAHEAAIIREFLASEVSSGVVRVEEYALLQNSFQRTKEERRVLWRYGIKQWLRVKSLYQTEIGLAFRKWHVSMGDKPKQGDVQPEEAYRQRIKRLRQEIVVAEARKNSKQTVAG
jgi:RsiW-degrading membrane proteinase PrsW (M82 family)/pSer/pThr/pTyr-binding forkhead associated (FHA) protein